MDIEVVAYHEAGHAVAATLCGHDWVATIVPEGYNAGHVDVIDKEGLDPERLAFFAWAGPWAQAQFTGRDLFDVFQTNGYWDFEADDGVEHFWMTAGRRTHRMVWNDRWARELGSAWDEVRLIAMRLATEDTVCSLI